MSTAEEWDRGVPYRPGGDRRKRGRPPLVWIWFNDVNHEIQDETFVKRLLTTGGMSVVYGESNCGKSFFSMNLGYHVALGWDWHGRKVLQGGVLYIAAEGGRGVQKRITAFRQHHNLLDDLSRVPFVLIPESVDLRASDIDAIELIDVAEGVQSMIEAPIRLIVVDTLARAIAGGNENASEDMTAFIANVDRLRQKTGAHVLIVHHSGKDTAKGARGHSSLRAATDTEIEIVKDGFTGIATANVKKQRDGESGDEFTFDLEQVEIGTDDDGEPITSCVVVPTIGQGRQKKRREPTGQAGIALSLLRNAIIDGGKPAPASKHIPGGTNNVVPLSIWRSYCYSGGLTEGDNIEAKKKAFKRVRERLQQLGFVGVWEDMVWLVD